MGMVGQAAAVPVEGQQQGPQRGEEWLLDARQAAVFGGGCVQAFEGQKGQREQSICQEQSLQCPNVPLPAPTSPEL